MRIDRRFVSVALLLIAAFAMGWFLRDRKAVADEALHERLDVLTQVAFGTGRDRFVLVMLDKGRASELPAILTRQMAEKLTSTRHNLNDAPGSLAEMEARIPWASALMPNIANEFRRAGEYLERSGGYSDAAADAKWLVAASSEPVVK